MKCQNCGEKEINFHYSSNVNGCVTETHLCSDCAAKSGYDLGRMFDTKSALFGFLPPNVNNAFMSIPLLWFTVAPENATWPQIGLPSGECACGSSCETPVHENTVAEIDGEMQKRREINIIREQMNLAAGKEDFEEAIRLREQIRQMEAE